MNMDEFLEKWGIDPDDEDTEHIFEELNEFFSSGAMEAMESIADEPTSEELGDALEKLLPLARIMDKLKEHLNATTFEDFITMVIDGVRADEE